MVQKGNPTNNCATDLVIGCVANYEVHNIANWVNSLKMSGFSGDKIALCYDLADDVTQYLKDNGFECCSCTRVGSHIFVQRFYDKWRVLREWDISKYRFIIATDTRDVIFQKNPSDWLEQNLHDKKILVGSECLKFVDEIWGNETLNACFKHLYQDFSQNVIYNAGTIAGEIRIMRDLFLNVYQFGLSAKSEESDQPALNILLSLEHIKPLVKFAKQEDGWCAQLGTVMDPRTIEKYRSKLLEPAPQIDLDGTVVNSDNIPFALVHQYDRIPELSKILDQKYGGRTKNPPASLDKVGQESLPIRRRAYNLGQSAYHLISNYAKKNEWHSVVGLTDMLKRLLLCTRG